MKTLVIAALLALSFTTGFTCSKNTPEATADKAATQEQMAAPVGASGATGDTAAVVGASGTSGSTGDTASAVAPQKAATGDTQPAENK